VSLAFWYAFFQIYAWETLHVPMGLGGAVYPAFFSLPVIIGTLGYQLGLGAVAVKLNRPAVGASPLWRVITPSLLIVVALVLWCPTDTGRPFVVEFLRAVRGQ
jgi:hypothetical protein